MTPCIMLDTETLATSRSACILTLGAVKFDPFSMTDPYQPFYVRINVEEQTALGRTIDDDTLSWWAKQSADIYQDAFSDEDRISMTETATQLNKYVAHCSKIYCQGPTFDIVILEDFYRMLGLPIPWQYWQIRDSRTIFDMGDDSLRRSNTQGHNALADAYYQAITVQKIFNQLGVKRE